MSQHTPIHATIEYLRSCQAYRNAGGMVTYTTDPAWLVTMAINRRAGWPDDPSCSRGSAMPVNGHYPQMAAGESYRTLERLSHRVNTPRLIVRERECPLKYRTRLAHRFFKED